MEEIVEIVTRNIFDLKPHQGNIKIYGKDEDVSDVKANILATGLKYELTISENNTIISGHRRWKALTELVNEGHSEFATVKCIVKHYDTAEAELEALIIANSQRTKNLEQIGREALNLKEIYGLKAEKRMKLGKKSDPMADLPEGESGSTRDKIAKILHSTGNKWITPKNIDILVQSITKLDEFDKNGDSFNADVLRHELNKDKHNFAAIGKLTKNIDEISEDNKKKLLDDKITVNDAVKTIGSISDTPASSNEIPIPKTTDELLKIIDAFKKLPEYKKSGTMVYMLNKISTELWSVKKVNNVLNGKFTEEIQPILNLKFWKKLKYFSGKNDEAVKYTIIETLAIKYDGDCWQEQDEYENFDYNYDVELSLIEYANNFLKREHDYMIKEVTRLFGLFDELVCENEISDDLQDFLDDCNLPHVVLVTDHYYNLLGEFEINSNDLPFFGILDEFTSQKKNMVTLTMNIQVNLGMIVDMR